jgi:hypothetical protein
MRVAISCALAAKKKKAEKLATKNGQSCQSGHLI